MVIEFVKNWKKKSIWFCKFSCGSIWVLIIVSTGNVYIFVRPKNTTAVKGSRVKLLCQAEGFPYNITYRWYRDGIDVQLISSLKERSQILPDGTLAINNVAKDDGGWYKCCPTTNIGTPPEANAYLNVTCECSYSICQEIYKFDSITSVWLRTPTLLPTLPSIPSSVPFSPVLLFWIILISPHYSILLISSYISCQHSLFQILNYYWQIFEKI